MRRPYRTYRILPAGLAVLLFLAIGSMGVRLFQSKPHGMSPQNEVQAVYYALAWSEEAPETLSTPELRPLLARFDEGLAGIADRITVVSYEKYKEGFELVVRHSGRPEKTFTVSPNGVR